jgi:hypothetical protein
VNIFADGLHLGPLSDSSDRARLLLPAGRCVPFLRGRLVGEPDLALYLHLPAPDFHDFNVVLSLPLSALLASLSARVEPLGRVQQVSTDGELSRLERDAGLDQG